MALDNDLFKVKTNIPVSPASEPTGETTVAPSASPTPVPIVSSAPDEQPQKVDVSPQVREQAEAEAEATRDARASAHDAEVKAIEDAKRASAMESEHAVTPKFATDTKEPVVPTETPTSSSTNASQHTKNETEQKVSEKYITVLEDENTTLEQKIRILLEQYYTKNDPDFINLSKDEKDNYINQKLNELCNKLAPDKDKSASFMKINTLLYKSEKEGILLDDLMQKPSEKLDTIFRETKKELFSEFVDKLGNEDSDIALDKSIRMYLMYTDENFDSLKQEEQKSKIEQIREKCISFSKLEGTSDKAKVLSNNFAKAIIEYLNSTGTSYEEFINKTPEEQDNFIFDAYSQSGKYYQKLSHDKQTQLDSIQMARMALAELREGEHTYAEMFKLYDEQLKNGELEFDEYEMSCYENLKRLHKPEEKISVKSLDVLAMLASDIDDCDKVSNGELKNNVKDVVDVQLENVDINSDESDKLINDYAEAVNNNCDVDNTIIINNALKQKGVSNKKIRNFIDNVNADKQIIYSRDDQGASVAELSNIIAEIGSDTKKAECNNALGIATETHSDSFATDVLADLIDKQMTYTVTGAVNKTRSKESAFVIFENAIGVSQNPERKTLITQSSIETASREQKLYYGKEYAQIKDSAVTQGLAAATYSETDADVKTQLNSYVNYAILNNGYSSDELKNINTARETGQTSYERNSVSSDSNNTSNTNSTPSTNSKTPTANNTTTNPASAQTVNATANATTNTISTTAKVKVSPANSYSVSEMKAQLAQVNYEHSIALRDKALADLERVIDKIQTDQQVRAEKQAELAQKEAKTDEEIAQAIKEAEAKSVEDQKQAQEQITKETIAEIEQKEKLEKKYHISAETIEVLRNAQKQGDLSTIYTKLGEISAEAQKHFVQYLSRKDTATIIGFIRNRSTDKALIKELCRLNPGLIKSLDPQMLLDCGVEKADIIKFSDSHQLSVLMYDLAKVGNTEELRQFYQALGDDAQQVASLQNQPVPGDDRYFAQLNLNMSSASTASSNVVGNSRFNDGQTRQKIRRQDYPDYREFLA